MPARSILCARTWPLCEHTRKRRRLKAAVNGAMLIWPMIARRNGAMAVQNASHLDATDRQVLRELQANARMAYKELGQRVGLSASAVIERVRKLEDAGIITGYHAAVDAAKLGLPIEAYIRMRCFGERGVPLLCPAMPTVA